MNQPENIEGSTKPFKECSICQTEWGSRDNFLSDPDIELVGYQVHFEKLMMGILYFNHACKGTLDFYTYHFMDLYDGPVFAERATGGDECLEYCLHKNNLEPCPARCECASVREVLQVIKSWNKISPSN